MAGGGNHPIGMVQVRCSGGLGQGDGGYDGENEQYSHILME